MNTVLTISLFIYISKTLCYLELQYEIFGNNDKVYLFITFPQNNQFGSFLLNQQINLLFSAISTLISFQMKLSSLTQMNTLEVSFMM